MFSSAQEPLAPTGKAGELLTASQGVYPEVFANAGRAHGYRGILGFAPNHSYVKFRDAQGQFHNFETTNGHFASDAWIMASGYVKANAVAESAGYFLPS